jgi:hypothetical protein
MSETPPSPLTDEQRELLREGRIQYRDECWHGFSPPDRCTNEECEERDDDNPEWKALRTALARLDYLEAEYERSQGRITRALAVPDNTTRQHPTPPITYIIPRDPRNVLYDTRAALQGDEGMSVR